MSDIFREALITQIPKRPTLTFEVFRNTVLLAALVVTPLLPVDLGTPSRAKSIPYAEIPPNTLLRGIPQIIPFRNDHGLPPLKVRPTPQADSYSGVLTRGIPQIIPFQNDHALPPLKARTTPQGESNSGVLTRGIPQIIGFNQYDWPNPYRAKIIPQGDSWIGTTTRGIPPPPPLFPFDWQNPYARKPQRFDDPPNLIASTLKPLPTQPFFSIDLGTPAKARIAPLVDPVPNTLILGIPQIMGFNSYDWPNPVRVRPATVRDDLPNLAINLPPPFAYFDWWQPYRAKVTPQAESGEVLLLTTLFQAPTVLPFNLEDWPQPYKAKIGHYDWSVSINLPLQTVAIPNVVGETQTQGTTDLQNAGFVVAVQTAYSNTVSVGVIISEVPTGTGLLGSTVSITVSLGVQPVLAEQPAGSKRVQFIYRVTIDGVVFEFATYQQAIALLAQAKETARKRAQDQALWTIQPGKPVKIKAPVITVSSRQLRAAANQTKCEIVEIYQKELEIAEMRMLMELAQRKADDDDSLMLLM